MKFLSRVYAFEFVAITLVTVAVISILNSSRLLHTNFEHNNDDLHQSPLDRCRATKTSFGTFFSPHPHHPATTFLPIESYDFNTSVSWPLSNPVISPPLIVQPRLEDEDDDDDDTPSIITITIDAITNPFLYTTNNSNNLYLFYEAHKCTNTLSTTNTHNNQQQQQQPHTDIFIAGAESTDGGITWHHLPHPVLIEQRPLRHPFVFTYNSHHYMVVDADDDAQVILYKATSAAAADSDDDAPLSLPLPPPPLSPSTKWHYYDTIINKPLTGISFIYHPVMKIWFMFGSRPKTSSTSNEMMLDIHMASSPLGPWTRHPASPFIPSGDRSMVGSQFVISSSNNDNNNDSVQVWRVGKAMPSNTLAVLRVTLTEDEYIEEEEDEGALIIDSSSSYKEGRWDWQGYDSMTMIQLPMNSNNNNSTSSNSMNKQWIAVVGGSPYVVKKYPETEALMVVWYCNVGIVMFKVLAVLVAAILVWTGVRSSSRVGRGVLVRSGGIGRMVLGYCSNDDDDDEKRRQKKIRYNKVGQQQQQHYSSTISDTSIRASFGDDIEVGDAQLVGYRLASSGTIKRTNIVSPSSSYDKNKKQRQYYIKRATTTRRREKEEKPTHIGIITSVMKITALLLSCTLLTGSAYLAQSALQLASPFLLQSPYSAPLPVNGEYSKFTLMVQSYEARLPNLKLYIDHYSKCPSVGEVLIVYNTVQQNNNSTSTTAQDVLDSISSTAATSNIISRVLMHVLNGRRGREEQDTFQSSSIRVRVEGTNSMNNRYKPDPLIHHRGVLSLDDDLIIPCHDVEYAFSQWRKHPSSLVGFFPRLVDNNSTTSSGSSTLQYHGEPYAIEKGRYNLILSGAAFIDTWTYFPLYWSDKNKEGREMVDEVFNCDDILFNLIVHHHHEHYNNNDNSIATVALSSSAIEFVRPERRLDLSGLSGVGISHESGKFIKTANVCLERLVEMFGGNPLKGGGREFEVGWRKPMCDERRNELDCVWV